MPIDIKDKTIEVFGRTLHRTYADDWIAEWDWSNEQFSISAKLSVLPVGHGSEPTRRASVHVAYQGTDRRSAYFDEFDQTIEAAEANLKQFFADITWFASEDPGEKSKESDQSGRGTDIKVIGGRIVLRHRCHTFAEPRMIAAPVDQVTVCDDPTHSGGGVVIRGLIDDPVEVRGWTFDEVLELLPPLSPQDLEEEEEGEEEEEAETFEAVKCEMTSREAAIFLAAYCSARAIRRCADSYKERQELCAWAIDVLGDIHHVSIDWLPEGSAELPLAIASVEEEASLAAKDAGEQWGGPAHQRVCKIFALALRWELFGRPSGRGAR